ncbi:Cof-type HAD-IIB family hydrolase [Anaerophilus nitritogenes]|uniref:Cof-type HAD-IIB family hydrolase n=1 Tax=Anaerophilus nitritogenes TaxID=2498136 RepID=UPI00101D3DF5|nr:Cof-type HAD-IIB family hydrolase [Anaerophilus nitritogenes]
MYKLVVSDMDGTLLNSKNVVSEENKIALQKLIDKDIHIAIATGRIYTSAKVYAKYLDIVTPIIACNGAIVKDLNTNEILYESYMEKEDVLKVIEICKKYGLYYQFYNEDTFYTEELAYSSLKYSEWNKTLKEEDRVRIELIKDGYSYIQNHNEKIYKMSLMSDDQKILVEARKELETIDSLEVSKSWYNNIEIMKKGVSKGRAIEELTKYLGVKREEIISFGDNENDMSMLNYAGLGVAMGNSEEIVKKSADYITSTNDEDGVAKALYKFVL